MIRALDKLANDEALQERLYTAFGTGASPRLARDIVDAVSDMLTEQYSVLLLGAGYRTPPPPPASELVEQVRQAISNPRVGRLYGPGHIEQVFDQLRDYVAHLRKHLADTRLKQIRRSILADSRPILAGLAFLSFVLNHVEVTLGGGEFDYSVHFSKDDIVKVEVTVPLDPVVEIGDALTQSAAVALRQAIVRASLVVVGQGIDQAISSLETPSRLTPPKSQATGSFDASARLLSSATREIKGHESSNEIKILQERRVRAELDGYSRYNS